MLTGLQLALIVLFIVLGATVVIGVLGTLIDRGGAGHDLGEDR